MKILADENMPYVEQLFGDLGTIEAVNGRTLTSEQVKDADVLLVRSVTKVNQALLSLNTNLKFVGSATIGTDHIDQSYLASQGIPFTNAPGCNATAVGEFAFIAMLELAKRFDTELKGKVVGIVGAGNTGSAVAKCLEAYGVEVLLNDPLIEADDPRTFVSLEALTERADVISLHVPLTKDGAHKTWYLFDEQRLQNLKPDTWLLNCCRGEVIDNRALIKIKAQRPDIKLVLDVWEGEPEPMLELVPFVELATPHIAGYSLEGKARGTYMLYQKLMAVLGIDADKSMTSLLPTLWSQQVSLDELPSEKALLQLSRFVYDLRDDDELFRKTLLDDSSIKAGENSANNNGFDLMRKNHKHRREFSALKLASAGQSDVDWLLNLGFSGVGR
ncbi:D-isomer specific 2-hydroxyacid dehydrogenase, catalytic region [Shewanella sediminis HAW-EB3]|uniref:Erythronate-4-phosphate dehydrogenase n=1 Tax=Shewanella sediminis (strain HAW-EB3) TaxID=425104 RepID=PDXB_SHESH|nr:4-phosphoerythronate dehydrogenase [Shewanella sediminis]A8FTT7.1 RecName: Full=Erythronate-4-phosphate dehydrogenase [Shewanella sediminis HAW-EB3]ABV36260.1 D-isomer specific 2-hydroxyacid dehydrogenase, catalytic region [Shewanella sediminis HAW-EB3]